MVLGLIGKPLELGRILSPPAAARTRHSGLDLDTTAGETRPEHRRQHQHGAAEEHPQDLGTADLDGESVPAPRDEVETVGEPREEAVEGTRQRRAAEPPLGEDLTRLLPRVFLRQRLRGGQLSPGFQPGGGGQNGGWSLGGGEDGSAAGGGVGSAGDAGPGPGCQPGGGGQNGGWLPPVCTTSGMNDGVTTSPGARSTPSRRASSRRSKPSFRTRRSMYKTVMKAAAAGVATMLPNVVASVLRMKPVTVLRAGLAKATPTTSPVRASVTTQTRR